MAGEMSPISSRKIVPLSASSNRPLRRASAEVNAPRSWPNSSDSSRLSGSAAQLIAIRLPWRSSLEEWTALAISSLPVPVSPSISTVLLVPPMWRMSWKILCISGFLEMMLWKLNSSP